MEIHESTMYLVETSHSKFPTLHVLSSATKMFLAAKSRWTKAFLVRYSIPDATCWQKRIRSWGVSGGTISPGLHNYVHTQGNV